MRKKAGEKEKPICFVRSGEVVIPILEFFGEWGSYYKTGSPFKEYATKKFTGTLTETETVHAEEAYRLARAKIRELKNSKKPRGENQVNGAMVQTPADTPRIIIPETW